MSHLDYCNSVFTCVSKNSLGHLQVVQKVAVRLLIKTLGLTLHEQAPAYIIEAQRSCDQDLLTVHHPRLKTTGDGASAIVTPPPPPHPLSLRNNIKLIF